MKLFELSLRPYNGRCFLTTSRQEYAWAHKKIFTESEELDAGVAGRFAAGEGRDKMWTYLVYAATPDILAHELSHVIFHTFDRVGIDPREGGNEPFCYMLSQLMKDASEKNKRKSSRIKS